MIHRIKATDDPLGSEGIFSDHLKQTVFDRSRDARRAEVACATPKSRNPLLADRKVDFKQKSVLFIENHRNAELAN
jgi:hypothetical protein